MTTLPYLILYGQKSQESLDFVIFLVTRISLEEVFLTKKLNYSGNPKTWRICSQHARIQRNTWAFVLCINAAGQGWGVVTVCWVAVTSLPLLCWPNRLLMRPAGKVRGQVE